MTAGRQPGVAVGPLSLRSLDPQHYRAPWD